jgi:hypothetical protein
LANGVNAANTGLHRRRKIHPSKVYSLFFVIFCNSSGCSLGIQKNKKQRYCATHKVFGFVRF